MAIDDTNTRKRGLIITLSIIVGLIILTLVSETSGITHFFHKPVSKSAPSSASQETKGETPPKSAPDGNTSSGASTDKTQGSGSESSNLIEPRGNFVSNHHPNLSGSPAPSNMNSICSTTPGAYCKITFIKDGVIKSLANQKVDAGGSTYWNWNLQDIGLTEGSWKIEATATLNGQSVSAVDALALEVGK